MKVPSRELSKPNCRHIPADLYAVDCRVIGEASPEKKLRVLLLSYCGPYRLTQGETGSIDRDLRSLAYVRMYTIQTPVHWVCALGFWIHSEEPPPSRDVLMQT